MKILIYTEYFFPIQGGVQTVVFELARGLAEWVGSPADETAKQRSHCRDANAGADSSRPVVAISFGSTPELVAFAQPDTHG